MPEASSRQPAVSPILSGPTLRESLRLNRVGSICLCTLLVWGVNWIWLARDSRPPVWDMALHQTYALNYLNGAHSGETPLSLWDRTGNYPPFVHLAIAFCFLLFHPSPHVAALANIPATLLLLWALFELASDLAGSTAARWACLLTALTPYMIWLSRETVLDYWLSAWFVVSLVLLRRTRGFESRRLSLMLGAVLGLGLLTKWLYAGLIAFPLAYVAIQHRVWRPPRRAVNMMDSLLVGGGLAAIWYLPNAHKLIAYFQENARIGAREGEPPVFSAQSLIYYLRLLEGYQFFALIFALLILGIVFAYRRKLVRDGGFLAAAIFGGWLVMTLLRTKDPRFTMPLLAPLTLLPAAWIAAWRLSWLNRTVKVVLVAVLVFQAYMTNFGISWLPERIVIADGYQGSLQWTWNLYLQDYFDILGPPKHENWRQEAILRKIAEDSGRRGVSATLALVPDLPYFNSTNFLLQARLMDMQVHIGHLQSAEAGMGSFDGYRYVLMTESDQGMSWTTSASAALNRIIVDQHEIFRLVGLYDLPNGDSARLYFVERGPENAG